MRLTDRILHYLKDLKLRKEVSIWDSVFYYSLLVSYRASVIITDWGLLKSTRSKLDGQYGLIAITDYWICPSAVGLLWYSRWFGLGINSIWGLTSIE